MYKQNKWLHVWLVVMVMVMASAFLIIPVSACESGGGTGTNPLKIGDYKEVESVECALKGMKNWVMGISVSAGIFGILWYAVQLFMQFNDQEVVNDAKRKMKFIALITLIVASLPYIVTWFAQFLFSKSVDL